MNFKKFILFIIIYISIFPCIVFAQNNQVNDVNKSSLWFTLHSGYFTTSVNREGLTLGSAIMLIKNKYSYTFRYSRFEEFSRESPNESQRNIGFIMSKTHLYKHFRFSYGTGIGITYGLKRGQYLYTSGGGGFSPISFDIKHYENHRYTKPSIPVEFRFMLRPNKEFSPGISIYSDLNTERNYLGIALTFAFGNIKLKK